MIGTIIQVSASEITWPHYVIAVITLLTLSAGIFAVRIKGRTWGLWDDHTATKNRLEQSITRQKGEKHVIEDEEEVEDLWDNELLSITPLPLFVFGLDPIIGYLLVGVILSVLLAVIFRFIPTPPGRTRKLIASRDTPFALLFAWMCLYGFAHTAGYFDWQLRIVATFVLSGIITLIYRYVRVMGYRTIIWLRWILRDEYDPGGEENDVEVVEYTVTDGDEDIPYCVIAGKYEVLRDRKEDAQKDAQRVVKAILDGDDVPVTLGQKHADFAVEYGIRGDDVVEQKCREMVRKRVWHRLREKEKVERERVEKMNDDIPDYIVDEAIKDWKTKGYVQERNGVFYPRRDPWRKQSYPVVSKQF